MIERAGVGHEGQERERRAPTSFEDLFRLEYPLVARASMLLVGDKDLGREVAQESFTRLYERWDQMRSLEHARRFVFRVALNLGRSYLRRSRRTEGRGLLPLEGTADRSGSDEGGSVIDRVVIREALMRLSARQRACIVLVDYAGFDAAAAGRILRIRQGTVHAHLSRARHSLRSQLSAAWERGGSDERRG